MQDLLYSSNGLIIHMLRYTYIKKHSKQDVYGIPGVVFTFISSVPQVERNWPNFAELHGIQCHRIYKNVVEFRTFLFKQKRQMTIKLLPVPFKIIFKLGKTENFSYSQPPKVNFVYIQSQFNTKPKQLIFDFPNQTQTTQDFDLT